MKLPYLSCRSFRYLGLIALFALASISAAWAQGATKPIPIKLGHQAQPSWLLYTAKENKFFEKAGLAPTWLKFTTGAQSIAAMYSRSVDIHTPGITPLAAALAQGIPLVAIGIDNESPPSEGFAARKGTNIRKLEDLKGKTIGVARGSTAYYGLLASLKKKGITKDQVKLLMLVPPDQLGAMKNSDVDAVAVWEPWLGRQIKENGATFLGMEADNGVYTALSVVAAHADFLKENPEAVRRYLKALLMAHDHIQKNGPGIALNSMADLMGITKQHAEEMYKQSREPNIRRWNDPSYLYSVSKNGLFAKNSQEMANFLFEEKVIPKKVDINAAFDDSFVSQVLKESGK